MNENLRFFQYKHLPKHLQEVSKPFCELAGHLLTTLPNNREREEALDRLIEAKDAAVRSSLDG